MENYKIIDDTKIRHYWECDGCDEGVYVPPWEYQSIGSPYCAECDEDMMYVRTEMKS